MRPKPTGSDMTPHVVIVGGGFGGLYAARALKRAPVRVTVIDRRNYHLFQPLLYQVATATLSPAAIARPIRNILQSHRNTEVMLAEVERVDAAGTDPEHETYRSELREAIDTAIERMDEHHRVPFVMREVDDLSYEEIAEAIGIPVGTVKSRLNRARNSFRSLLPVPV